MTKNNRLAPTRRALTALLATGLIALGSGTSARADDSGGLESFLDAVASPRGASYAVVVDTSQSMADDGSYDKVRAVLPTFLKSLRSKDRVCLIPFSDGAPACEMVSRDEALQNLDATLPTRPDGTASNFGRAFEQALDGLQRTDTDVCGVLLLSDAELDAPDDPRYRDFGASGWSALRRQASGLPSDRSLTGYGISLRSGTDVKNVLAKVFPSYRMLDTSGTRISAAMTQAQDDTRLRQAALSVDGDRGKGIAVSWPGTRKGRPVPAASDIRVRLTATTKALPVRLTGLRIAGLPEGVALASDLPGSVDLRPGESRDLDLSVRSATTRHKGWKSDSEPETWNLSVTGKVSTPLATAARRYVGKDARLAGGPVGEPLAVEGTARTSADPLRWIAAAVAFLALLVPCCVWLLRRHRPVQGTVSAEAVDARMPLQIPLQGRREVTADLSSLLESAGTVKIKSVPGPLREQPPIRLRCRTADRPEREIICTPGQTVLLCGIEFHYTTLPAQRM
ncbi:VWA domain-containing protein [Streptomyces sp. NPDC021080]|uniref:VWA domain-containing protein n=1 Tax=Streptomyces sp. NPDC021080 TaxID=3365110 RepID=UPI0037B96D8D